MKLTNYHTHCSLDDGVGSMDVYAAAAFHKGYEALGFSCHTPWCIEDDWHLKESDLETYFSQLDRLNEAYHGKLEIYRGLELDYVDTTGELAGSQYLERLDYTIGSVHMFKDNESGRYLSFDGPPEELTMLLNNTFSGDGRRMVEHYYRCLNDLMKHHRFDILGHFDLIKKRNRELRFFDADAPWYRKLVLDALDTAAEHTIRIELNTGAIARGVLDEPYPAPWLLKHCRERNIPMVLSADAHNPINIDCWYEPAIGLLREAGYRELDIFSQGRWVSSSIMED